MAKTEKFEVLPALAYGKGKFYCDITIESQYGQKDRFRVYAEKPNFGDVVYTLRLAAAGRKPLSKHKKFVDTAKYLLGEWGRGRFKQEFEAEREDYIMKRGPKYRQTNEDEWDRLHDEFTRGVNSAIGFILEFGEPPED